MTREDEQDAISAFLQRADQRSGDPLDPAHPTNAPEGGESGTPVDETDDVIDTFMGNLDEQPGSADAGAPAEGDDWYPGADLEEPPHVDHIDEGDRVDEVPSVVLAAAQPDAEEDVDASPSRAKRGLGAMLGGLFGSMGRRSERGQQPPSISSMRIPLGVIDPPPESHAKTDPAAGPAPRKRISMREGAIMIVVGLIVVAWLLNKGGPAVPVAAIDPPALENIEIDTAPESPISDSDIELPPIDGAPDKRLLTVAVTPPLDFTAGEPDVLADQVVLPDMPLTDVPGTGSEATLGDQTPSDSVPAIAAGVAEMPSPRIDVPSVGDTLPAAPASAADSEPVTATFIPADGGAAIALPTTNNPHETPAPVVTAAAPTPVPTAAPVLATPPTRAPAARLIASKPDVKVLAVMIPGNCWSCTAAAVLMSRGVESVVASGDKWNGYEVTIAGDRVSLEGRGGRWSFLPES